MYSKTLYKILFSFMALAITQKCYCEEPTIKTFLKNRLHDGMVNMLYNHPFFITSGCYAGTILLSRSLKKYLHPRYVWNTMRNRLSKQSSVPTQLSKTKRILQMGKRLWSANINVRLRTVGLLTGTSLAIGQASHLYLKNNNIIHKKHLSNPFSSNCDRKCNAI